VATELDGGVDVASDETSGSELDGGVDVASDETSRSELDPPQEIIIAANIMPPRIRPEFTSSLLGGYGTA